MTFSLSQKDLDEIPTIPNISITTIPIKSLISKYYIVKGDLNNGLRFLKDSEDINPYIHYDDYLLGLYFLNLKEIDSAYFYTKKAFFGWPKNIEHYKLFNQVLSIQKDTTEIFSTYKFADSIFKENPEFQNSFIDSYTDAKLGYMIFNYPDEQSIEPSIMIGKWQQVYEFEGGNISKMNNLFRIDNNFFYSGADNTKYNYIFKNDTLNLFFVTNKKLINQIPVFYSPSFKTLIFKDIIRDLNSDNPERQDQFFKKIDD